MGERNGSIELERTVESIVVGVRHRIDHGDLSQLTASIDRDGLLQPVTITPDGVLVCGARRLAAIKQLGWRTVNVWVRSGITDRLGALLAEQDDNLLHKPLTATEQTTLYRELKELMTEEAVHRQAATQFGPGGKHHEANGAGESPAPLGVTGDVREQAARLITGNDASQRLERIARLQDLARDETQPAHVRDRAQVELDAITAGAPVNPAVRRINTELSLAELDYIAHDPDAHESARRHANIEADSIRSTSADMKTAELERLANEALQRVKDQSVSMKSRPLRPAPEPKLSDGPVARFPVRAFRVLWSEMANWWLHHDPTEIAEALTDDELEAFQETIDGTERFARQVAEHRTVTSAVQGNTVVGVR